MGKRIGKDDPLWRNTKARYGGKFMMWNACVAMKRESDRIVADVIGKYIASNAPDDDRHDTFGIRCVLPWPVDLPERCDEDSKNEPVPA